MPLLNITEVCEGVRLGLWRMEEEPEELLSGFPHLRLLEMPYKYPARQKEFLCVRALLLAMTGDPTLRIEHTESGRPVLAGDCKSPGKDGTDGEGKTLTTEQRWQVSISHTKGYAALMLSKEEGAELDEQDSLQRHVVVGVDIEYRSDRVAKIASHYIRPDEKAETLEQMLVLWCAKETLYKLHSDDNLQFFEMRAVAPPDGNELMLENMKRGRQVKVHVIPAPDYVLTWAVDFERLSLIV